MEEKRMRRRNKIIRSSEDRLKYLVSGHTPNSQTDQQLNCSESRAEEEEENEVKVKKISSRMRRQEALLRKQKNKKTQQQEENLAVEIPSELQTNRLDQTSFDSTTTAPPLITSSEISRENRLAASHKVGHLVVLIVCALLWSLVLPIPPAPTPAAPNQQTNWFKQQANNEEVEEDLTPHTPIDHSFFFSLYENPPLLLCLLALRWTLNFLFKNILRPFVFNLPAKHLPSALDKQQQLISKLNFGTVGNMLIGMLVRKYPMAAICLVEFCEILSDTFLFLFVLLFTLAVRTLLTAN